ncbi:MXAN_6640 family putative metalloprotease [Nocardioides pantholopis]|uniref:MXAN_6640 family putative metalloprotease n=1 Tax=Nocardioides pantholopis TaxID=2483798 RepID=UPI000F078ED6|nr:MXAN_6640 family putative metalloprotease [Nocardioides pantholopis]
MRRTAAAVLVALTAASLLPLTAAGSASAAEPGLTPIGTVAALDPVTPTEPPATVPAGVPAQLPTEAVPDVPVTAAEAQTALETATELIEGEAVAAAEDGPVAATPVEASLVMRDLFAAVPLLRGKDRARAEAILARPTDGAGDPQRFGYTVPSSRSCSAAFCVHYVTSTADAPPSPAWVQSTLSTMGQVDQFVTGTLGYRRPLTDEVLANDGGDARFDVYLKDLGSSGIYGYCAQEARRGSQAIAYCVLDNDFATWQYGGNPAEVLKVTAVHEYFHAVQYAYDALEDRWMLESTAAWVEERFADAINDNRQYLRFSQVRRPGQALDTWSRYGGFNQYGNWAFWEHLSQKHGRGIVRKVWERATPTATRNLYSVRAIDAALAKKGGIAKAYRSFVSANLTPARSYREGSAWPSPKASATRRLTAKRKSAAVKVRVNHLASANVRVKPAASLRGKRWALKVRVDGPGRAAAPSAVVLVKKRGGGVARKVVRLNKKGTGTARVAFGRGQVKGVTVALVNASTRYRCGALDAATASRLYSCLGAPRDDRAKFRLGVTAVRR